LSTTKTNKKKMTTPMGGNSHTATTRNIGREERLSKRGSKNAVTASRIGVSIEKSRWHLTYDEGEFSD